MYAVIPSFGRVQCLGSDHTIGATDACAMRSLLVDATNGGSASGGDGSSDAAQHFLTEALAIATAAAGTSTGSEDEESSTGGGASVAGSSTAHAVSATPRSPRGADGCTELLWILGAAGQLAHAMRQAVLTSGARSYGQIGQIEVRPPDSLWTRLSPALWSGDGRGELAAAYDLLGASYGWRAVRAGLDELLGPDAHWLLPHRESDDLPRGVSSYRFTRVLPLRSMLGDGGASRQYAMQLGPDAGRRWLRQLRQLQTKELARGVLPDWEALQLPADGPGTACAAAARQRLAQAEGLVQLARSFAAIVTPASAGSEVKGEVQGLLAAAANVSETIVTDVWRSAVQVPALVPADELGVEALQQLLQPMHGDEGAAGSRSDSSVDLPHAPALRALLGDASCPWGALRRAYMLLQEVRSRVDKDVVFARELERRHRDMERGAATLGRGERALLEQQMQHEPDALETCGAAVTKATDEVVDTLKALHVELRALEYEFGRHGAPSDDSSAYVLCPVLDPQSQADADADPAGGNGLDGPVAALWWSETHLLVADAPGNALRLVNSATGAVSTMIGGRGAGHADGNLNISKLSAPRGLCVCGEGLIVVADTGDADHMVAM